MPPLLSPLDETDIITMSAGGNAGSKPPADAEDHSYAL